mgnify:FL=1
MISERCNSLNLLNHIKQKKISYSLDYEYISDKMNKDYLSWIGTFKINNKSFKSVGQNKREVKLYCIKQAEEELYSLVSVKK